MRYVHLLSVRNPDGQFTPLCAYDGEPTLSDVQEALTDHVTELHPAWQWKDADSWERTVRIAEAVQAALKPDQFSVVKVRLA